MSNLFACLDSDNDEPVVKKPVAAAGKDATKPTTAGAKSAANGNDKNAGKSPAAAKPANAAGPKKDGPKNDRPQGDRPPKTDRPKSAPVVEGGVEGGPPKEDARGGGRGGRGGKEVRNRGGRGNEEAPHREGADGVVRPPRKREFDRRSGTGRGREQSKGGRGAHGFGNEGQEAQDAEKDPASAEIPVEGAVEGEEGAAAVEPVVEAEPEPPTMTIDEFLAQRAASRANTQLFGPAAIRKVETDMTGARTAKEDLGNWGGYGMNQVESEKQKEQRSHAKKQIIDVGFKNAALEQSRDRDDERPTRGGRGEGGGRGGGRFSGRDGGRGGGRGGDRSSRGSSGGRGGYGGRGIDVNDANAFPSL